MAFRYSSLTRSRSSLADALPEQLLGGGDGALHRLLEEHGVRRLELLLDAELGVAPHPDAALLRLGEHVVLLELGLRRVLGLELRERLLEARELVLVLVEPLLGLLLEARTRCRSPA